MLVLKDLQESIYSDDFDTALLATSEMLRVLYIQPKNINNWGGDLWKEGIADKENWV